MGTAGGLRHHLVGAACSVLTIAMLAQLGAATLGGMQLRALELKDKSHGQLALSDFAEPGPKVPSDGGLTAPQNNDIGDSLLSPEADGVPADSLETDVVEPDAPIGDRINVRISHDLSELPAPVMRMRELIVDAAAKGDIEGLRPLLGTGPTRTELSISGYEGDPIEFLQDMSGDEAGHELLAILLDILHAGYAHLDPGEPTELYLWPYFYSIPLESLDDRQRVELFRIITAGDYEDMQAYGGYIFYRTAIGPDGDWKFFVAGD